MHVLWPTELRRQRRLPSYCGGAGSARRLAQTKACDLEPGELTRGIHERKLDREDALLSAWRRRRDTPRLTDKCVIEPTEIDLDRWRRSSDPRVDSEASPAFVVLTSLTSARKLPGGPDPSRRPRLRARCCPATHAVDESSVTSSEHRRDLVELLDNARTGEAQLPDFQRGGSTHSRRAMRKCSRRRRSDLLVVLSRRAVGSRDTPPDERRQCRLHRTGLPHFPGSCGSRVGLRQGRSRRPHG
jgi:hypothetical protein